MTNFNFLLNNLSYLSSEDLVGRPMDSTCFRSAPVPPSFRLRLHPLRMVATLLLLLCLGVGEVWGAVTPLSLPHTWEATDGRDAYTEDLGCSKSGLGSDYKSEGTYLKFDGTGDYLIIQLADAPSKLTYNIKGNTFSGGTFKVQQSSDGSSYSDLASYTSDFDGSKEHSLASTTRYIKFIYTTKSSGNVGLGTIGITKKPAAATITLNNYSGSATTTGYYSGDDFTLPSTNNYTCGTKTFVGWSTVEVAATNTKPTSNFYELGEEVTLGATNTFYAVFANTAAGGTAWTKATSIAVGDIVVFTYGTTSSATELTGVTTSGTTIGTATARTKIPDNIAGTFPLTIESGNNSGSLALKNGTNYLSWSAGNSLTTSTTKDNASSWTVNVSSGDFTLTNVGTTNRILQYNPSSPRWACYTTSQATFQIYKQTTLVTYSNYATSCCTQLGSINGSVLWSNGTLLGGGRFSRSVGRTLRVD